MVKREWDAMPNARIILRDQGIMVAFPVVARRACGRSAVGRLSITALDSYSVPTMSTSVTGQGSSISQHLHATKKILQDVVFDVKYV